jgi:hypothetical protein
MFYISKIGKISGQDTLSKILNKVFKHWRIYRKREKNHTMKYKKNRIALAPLKASLQVFVA